MAKKNKKKQGNVGCGHSTIARVKRTVNPFEPKRSRKFLTLAIMGGATFFVLKGCSVDNDGDGTFYSTLWDCIDDGNSTHVCTEGWSKAKTDFYAQLPKEMTQNSCLSQFNDCYYDYINQRWLPVISGFLLSDAIRKDRDEEYVYSIGGRTYASRPVWRTPTGDYSWRTRSKNSGTATDHKNSIKKTSTVSRGGYGRSSSARGSWGG